MQAISHRVRTRSNPTCVPEAPVALNLNNSNTHKGASSARLLLEDGSPCQTNHIRVLRTDKENVYVFKNRVRTDMRSLIPLEHHADLQAAKARINSPKNGPEGGSELPAPEAR